GRARPVGLSLNPPYSEPSAADARPIQREAPLADEDLEDLPGIRVVARLEIRVGHEQRLAEERQAPRRMELGAGDPSDLVPGRVQDRDLVRSEQGHVQVAGAREGECGRLRWGLCRIEREAVNDLEIGGGGMVDE